MLTWMQHHKKYLVVTIWVSVIAFVGAGFVGWGAYDFNTNRSSSVAVVNDEKISFNEFNARYNQIFSYYNQISNGALNEESAQEIGIEQFALKSLIEDKLLLSFAKELGFNASETEVVQKLASTAAFQDSYGDFNKSMYYELLSLNGLTPKHYEESLSNEIILEKLFQLFSFTPRQEELDMLASSYFMRDSLNIEKLEYKQENITVNEEKLKDLWQENKNEYKTKKRYEISSYFLSGKDEKFDDEELENFYNEGSNKLKYKDFNGKILSFVDAKKEVTRDYMLEKLKEKANAKFIELKNAQIHFQKDENITESDVYYPLELLSKAKKGEILRPFEYKDGYIITRLNEVFSPRVKTFEEARAEVIPLYKSKEARELLEERAKQRLNTFKGANIGFVSRDSLRSSTKIDEAMLNDSELSYFLMNVFNSDVNSSYVLLNDNKAILYKIVKQKLKVSPNTLKQYESMLKQNVQALKSDEIKQELLKELEKRYRVKIYYKGK
ncbi:SurA N-terminal domain-containing protein [Campylobacter sp. MIT 21-1685]|uniref:peptidylprolyl isomerase n=1 Tax=unclassified Campylobacter TaxID=2593542 RepID=UPI00224A6F27|nr:MULTISPECIES: peptidylprolyl isomerase [unclassified Campylobacter]MCX2682327.1 SurA N-terminal domain-containing protein [Campylobacter sp. MIT 21-1684]MCX2750607.1 SurA N-terminal domain-containing protein [Campylobacter sp. MIT 21-1682]MCX2806846.1 SurA N-terminal domain-containing protein [Campylobacter sp. MIT 21-1685]